MKNVLQHRVKNIAYFSSTVWSLLCLHINVYHKFNKTLIFQNIKFMVGSHTSTFPHKTSNLYIRGALKINSDKFVLIKK